MVSTRSGGKGKRKRVIPDSDDDDGDDQSYNVSGDDVEIESDDENFDESDEDSDVAGPAKKKKRISTGTAKTSAKGRAKVPQKQPSSLKPGLKAKQPFYKHPQPSKLGDFAAVEAEIGKDTALATSSMSPMEIESDHDLRHLRMFNNVVNVLKAAEPNIKPTRDATVALDTLLSDPVVGNRQWSFSAIFTKNTASKERWQCQIMDHSKPRLPSSKRYKVPFNESFMLDKIDVPDKQLAADIAKKYCLLLERIPFPLQGRPKDLKVALVDVVARSLSADFRVRLIPCRHHKLKDDVNVRYRGGYFFIDSATGDRSQAFFQIQASRVKLDKPIPPIPAHVEVADFQPSGLAKTDNEKSQERLAYKLGVYISYKMHGLFGSHEALKVKRDLLMSQFYNAHGSHVGPYGGHRLYRYIRLLSDRCVVLKMSEAVRKSLVNVTGGPENLPAIRIYGMSRVRAQQVVQVLVQTWMRTGDIFESWKNACVAADYLNIAVGNGEDVSGSTCSCSPEQSQTECHSCDLCGQVQLCQALALNTSGTALTCEDCRSRNPNLVRKYVTKRVNGEYQALKLGGNRSAEIARAMIELDAKSGGTSHQWTSDYTGADMDENDLVRGRVRNPFAPTVDGVFPVFNHGDPAAGLRYHTPGNIALCEMFINSLKDQYPPGILQIIAQWLNSKQDDCARAILIKAMDDIHLVRKTVPKNQKSRLRGKPFDMNAWKVTKQEFLTCHPGSASTTQRRAARVERYFKYFTKALDPEHKQFRPADVERVQQVIKEIEEKFADSDRKLQRSEDGCPFPFPCTQMPPDWSWWSAWALFEERLIRMWLACNGYWVTIDCIETLFLECIFQFFEPTDVDPLMFIVLSIYYGHPFRFAVARRRPGQAMRTPWTTQRPTGIHDRDVGTQEHPNSNISFESHIVNMMKQDFKEDTYAEMIRRVKDIDLDKKYYDPEYRANIAASGHDAFFDDNDDASDGDYDESEETADKLFEFEDENEDEDEYQGMDDEDDEVVIPDSEEEDA